MPLRHYAIRDDDRHALQRFRAPGHAAQIFHSAADNGIATPLVAEGPGQLVFL